MLALVNDVLDLSTIEAGQMTVHDEEFDPALLVAGIVAALEPAAAKQRNALRLVCPPALPTIRSDATKVRQILLNLLSNACKFTESGCVTLEVRSSSSAGRDCVVFRVWDTGVGMTEEQIARIGRPFAQADSSTSRKYGGTGLGLSISRSFSDLLGGTFDIASTPGVGSVFTVAIPLRRPHAVAETPREAPAPAPGRERAPPGRAGRERGLAVACLR